MTASERFDVDPAIAPILATALDVVAVTTPVGAEHLSAGVPRTVMEIEQFMAAGRI